MGAPVAEALLDFEAWLRTRPADRRPVKAKTWIEAKRQAARLFRTAVENVDAEIVKGLDQDG
jgi:hypothetical protein